METTSHRPLRVLVACEFSGVVRDAFSTLADALEFVQWLLDAPVPRIAVENPPGRIGSQIRKADQYVQPWWFGHGETKTTGLWLVNLPRLVPTWVVSGRDARVHREAPGADRWKRRSRTLPGIAGAMAAQWGGLVKLAVAA